MPIFLLQFSMWWKTTAWPWLKKYWYWPLSAIGALVLYLLGRSHGATTVVASNEESSAAQDFRTKVEAETAFKVAKLDSARLARENEVLREHAETVKALTDEQKAQALELSKDPEELNSFLLRVGQDVRK